MNLEDLLEEIKEQFKYLLTLSRTIQEGSAVFSATWYFVILALYYF